jgi:hypothetical protein
MASFVWLGGWGHGVLDPREWAQLGVLTGALKLVHFLPQQRALAPLQLARALTLLPIAGASAPSFGFGTMAT